MVARNCDSKMVYNSATKVIKLELSYQDDNGIHSITSSQIRMAKSSSEMLDIIWKCLADMDILQNGNDLVKEIHSAWKRSNDIKRELYSYAAKCISVIPRDEQAVLIKAVCEGIVNNGQTRVASESDALKIQIASNIWFALKKYYGYMPEMQELITRYPSLWNDILKEMATTGRSMGGTLNSWGFYV